MSTEVFASAPVSWKFNNLSNNKSHHRSAVIITCQELKCMKQWTYGYAPVLDKSNPKRNE